VLSAKKGKGEKAKELMLLIQELIVSFLL